MTSPTEEFKTGSVEAFDANWQHTLQNKRYHFKRGAPDNQIQFAFQNHWRVFKSVMGNISGGRALEVGCGRGSMGAFFADAGFQTDLLDTSAEALHIAHTNFDADKLDGSYICGNALSLPYPDKTFDVVLSIGLFEHFESIREPLAEQLRVIKPGGVFLGYIVPERPVSVQTLAIPVNALLKLGHFTSGLFESKDAISKARPKAPLYRNSYSAADYEAELKKMGAGETGSMGMFPVPLVSNSPNFPFSLMAPDMEHGLTKLWQAILSPRLWRHDPWTCPEWWGLAFLVWAKR
jgi:ubiquinone/menaquinone biosynthesis C-methylase UbiE